MQSQPSQLPLPLNATAQPSLRLAASVPAQLPLFVQPGVQPGGGYAPPPSQPTAQQQQQQQQQLQFAAFATQPLQMQAAQLPLASMPQAPVLRAGASSAPTAGVFGSPLGGQLPALPGKDYLPVDELMSASASLAPAAAKPY